MSETKWKMVPVEPTEAMIEAHFRAHAQAETVFAEVPDIWRAMLAASPEPPENTEIKTLVSDLRYCANDCMSPDNPHRAAIVKAADALERLSRSTSPEPSAQSRPAGYGCGLSFPVASTEPKPLSNLAPYTPVTVRASTTPRPTGWPSEELMARTLCGMCDVDWETEAAIDDGHDHFRHLARAVLALFPDPAAIEAAARDKALEEAAAFIERNIETSASEGVIFRERRGGNRHGMAYADAIRALKGEK